MRKKFFTLLLVVCSISCLNFFVKNARAVSIKYIDLPMIGAVYDSTEMHFWIAGSPNPQAQVHFDDGSVVAYPYANFILDTISIII